MENIYCKSPCLSGHYRNSNVLHALIQIQINLATGTTVKSVLFKELTFQSVQVFKSVVV